MKFIKNRNKKLLSNSEMIYEFYVPNIKNDPFFLSKFSRVVASAFSLKMKNFESNNTGIRGIGYKESENGSRVNHKC